MKVTVYTSDAFIEYKDDSVGSEDLAQEDVDELANINQAPVLVTRQQSSTKKQDDVDESQPDHDGLSLIKQKTTDHMISDLVRELLMESGVSEEDINSNLVGEIVQIETLVKP